MYGLSQPKLNCSENEKKKRGGRKKRKKGQFDTNMLLTEFLQCKKIHQGRGMNVHNPFSISWITEGSCMDEIK